MSKPIMHVTRTEGGVAIEVDPVDAMAEICEGLESGNFEQRPDGEWVPATPIPEPWPWKWRRRLAKYWALVAYGVIVTGRDFWYWHDGTFIVPWYRCMFPLLAAGFMIYVLERLARWRR